MPTLCPLYDFDFDELDDDDDDDGFLTDVDEDDVPREGADVDGRVTMFVLRGG